MTFRSFYSLAAISCCLAALSFASPVRGDETAAEGMTLEKTVSWINEVLADPDFSFYIDSYIAGGSTVGRQYQFSIDVGGSGSLKIYHMQSSGKPKAIIPSLRDPSDVDWKQTNTVSDWASCSESQLVIVSYRQTKEGEDLNESQHPGGIDVLAIKRSGNRLQLLIPLPLDDDLTQKLVRAFRHLLQRTKQEKNPF